MAMLANRVKLRRSMVNFMMDQNQKLVTYMDNQINKIILLIISPLIKNNRKCQHTSFSLKPNCKREIRNVLNIKGNYKNT